MSIRKLLALLLAATLLCCCFAGCQDKNDPEYLAKKAQGTTAVTVGDHKINAVELNYYYVEVVNGFYSEYSYYISALLDVTKPLNQQTFDEKTGQSWADYFLQTSLDNVKTTYALCDMAQKAGFTLSEGNKNSVKTVMESLEYYAEYYKYDSVDAYLVALFGNGATAESYKAYYERNLLADCYYTEYFESLKYNDEALREYESSIANHYNSYDYASYYLDASRFLTGGTKDANGKITYSDEEKAAAVAACKAAAEAIAAGSYATVKELNTALAAMEINAESTNVKATVTTNSAYNKVNSAYSEWVTADEREPGQLAALPRNSGTEEKPVIDGYYIVMYNGRNDNTFALKDVRHILIIPEGGTQNSITGYYDYTVTELSIAMQEAKKILAEFEETKKTEFHFGDLADKYSDDGDGTTGGLYRYVAPGQMVDAFDAWCFDENRQKGDCEIIRTEYGYHIMYFVGDSDLNYRDYLITMDMRNRDASAWLEELLKSYTVNSENLDFVAMDMILGS